MSVLKPYGRISYSPTSRTFKLNGNRLEGIVDGKEAVEQAIFLALSIERYAFPIFSSDYGVEFDELVGKQKSYVMADIKRRVIETLKEDDRIISIDDFEITPDGEAVIVKCKASSIYGDIEVERRVSYGKRI